MCSAFRQLIDGIHTACAQELAAPELAGLACALVAPESVSRPSIAAAYEPSARVCEGVHALEAARESLFELQLQAGIDAPLAVDLRLAGARRSPPATTPAQI